MRKFLLFLLSGILILFILSSCPGPNEPDPGPEEFEGVPGPIFTIPESLAVQSGKSTRAQEPEGVFEPFRFGLSFAKYCVDFIKDIIDALNENTIPANAEFVNDGELIVITTDAGREYATIIEIYTSDTAIVENKYLQISYTKGINKGESVFDVDVKESGSEIDMVKIFYDGTQDLPELQGWLTFNYDDAVPYIIYPVSVYFDAFKENDNVTIEGGVAYHYIFDDDTTYSAEKTYVDDHVYMYKSIADIVVEMAIAALYFPQKDIPLSELADWEVSDTFLYILFTWLNLPGNADVKATLETLAGHSIATKEDLYNVLDQYREEPAVAELLFILDLNNPIAYNAVDGYVANGTDVTADYIAIGNIDGVTFSMEPIDVLNLTITF